MQILVQTITDSAVDLADMRNSQFIDQSGQPGSELIRYANMAYKDLYQQIVLSYESYCITSYDFPLVGGVDTYALPDDFYKLNGVDLLFGDSGIRFTLTPYMFKDRNRYSSGLASPITFYGQNYQYDIVRGNIKFIPLPSGSYNIRLWYTPNPEVITTFSQTLSLPIGGDEYMSLYCACAMKAKEEDDSSQLDQKRIEVLMQLKNSLRSRDVGSPMYIVDEYSINAGALFPFSGGGF